MTAPGGVRLGRYRLKRRLAGGGMAEVYLARFEGGAGFERDVVLKRIRPDLAKSAEYVQMLLDEARIAATLHHPNIVQAFDVEEVDGEYFIAMEYLDGIDVRNVQQILDERDEVMPLENAVHIVVALADGLEHAHRKRDAEGNPLHIIHRDVSPHNVLLTREGGVKLVDFGIAKATNREAETQGGGLKGKLGYMSPEQVRGEPLDFRSDLFSLGIILFELTTGSFLFTGRSEYEIVLEIAEGIAPAPSDLDPDYPRELERITVKALSKDPAERYASAGAMQADLEAFARDYALSLSTRSLAELVEEMVSENHGLGAGRDSSHRPWVANLAMKAGAAALSLDDALDSLTEGADGSEVGVTEPASLSEGATAVDVPARTPTPARAKQIATDRGGRRARPASAHPQAAGSGASLGATNADPLADVAGEPVPELKSGKRALWVVTFALVAGGGAAVAYLGDVSGSLGGAGGAGAAADASRSQAAGGIEIAGAPAGAGVWLHLGEAPAESPPLPVDMPHQLRVEYPERAAHDVTVLPSRWAKREGEVGVWVSAELKPQDGGPGPEAYHVPDEPEGDAFRPTARGDGRIHIDSEPRGADVWLFVGVLPDVAIRGVPADRDYRLRAAKPGFEPAHVTAESSAFEPAPGREDKRAAFELQLEPRGE